MTTPRTAAGQTMWRALGGLPEDGAHIAAIEAEIAAEAAAPALTAKALAEALHALHSVELWQWWEPEDDGGALVRKGTSPEFAEAILARLAPGRTIGALSDD